MKTDRERGFPAVWCNYTDLGWLSRCVRWVRCAVTRRDRRQNNGKVVKRPWDQTPTCVHMMHIKLSTTGHREKPQPNTRFNPFSPLEPPSPCLTISTPTPQHRIYSTYSLTNDDQDRHQRFRTHRPPRLPRCTRVQGR